jgi:hypothetical protein
VIAMRGGGGLDLLRGDRQRAANRCWSLIEQLEAGLDDDRGVDLPGMRHALGCELERVAHADQRLADEHRRVKQPARRLCGSRRLLPADAASDLAAGRETLTALVRALVCLPPGCSDATRILNTGIVEQLKRIAKAKCELDAHLTEGG